MDMLGMTRHVDSRMPGLPIEYVSNDREGAAELVVLMPAALAAGRHDRTLTHFHRWSWHQEWPEALVISIADPAMKQSTALDGAWFIHPELDVLRGISALVQDVAVSAGIANDRIVFYGSSLGGFGAIACAAHVPGARAVAEVPQIHFENWQAQATKVVEDHILGGPVSALRDYAPERLSLTSRLEVAGLIPPLKLVTNEYDRSIRDQRDFIDWCGSVALPRIGRQTLVISDLVRGHKVLPKDDIVPLVSA